MNVQAGPLNTPDLTACDREPIHVPGSIQPHGLLLAVGPGGEVRHASRNIEEAIGVAVDALIGRRLGEAAPEAAAALEPLIRRPIERNARYVRTVRLPPGTGQTYDVAIHRSGELAVIEFEETPAETDVHQEPLDPTLRSFVERLHEAGTLADLCNLAARDVRTLTGFDRVLVYRFDENWNGSVIGEDRNERLPSYLDLRFPASDIPAQARELYRRNRLRIIPNASYVPVPIEPGVDARTGEPLDLSHSVLRSVSPVHLEYMRNMGTAASMSISILRDGVLWGLISCHNAEPRRVPLRVRGACDFLTQIFSLQVAARERAEEAQEHMRLGSIQTRLLAFMAEEERFIDGLLKHPEEFLGLADAAGAAVISGEHCWLVGETPEEADVRRLFDWLSITHREDVFATDALAENWPEAASYAEKASGVLAISVSKMHASYVLWFRPEVVRTVKWGGNPQKPVEEGTPARLHPRKSFEIWKENVQGRSLPWRPAEIAVVKELRNSVVGIVLRRAEELASLSSELQRSNKELEAFSYSVSHDLRAPFRHIVGYAELLKKNEGADLTERGRRYLDTIVESALTAGKLVDSLLNFSQMGRTSLRPMALEMSTLVDEVRQRLELEAKGRRIEWRVGPLPPVVADPIMLRLVVENLLSNAVKYSRGREVAVIEVGCRKEVDELVYFVRDNGVGFDMAYVNKLFGVFQRLHRMEDFEGTGIGLANVRRIVERHGGRVWAEGAVDRGATFFFSLPRAEGAK